MKHLIVLIIAALWSVPPAQSAEITVSPRDFSGTLIRINGRIFLGDGNVFADKTKSITDSANTIVWLTSGGGNFVAARAIAQMVRDRGYSTLVNRVGACASACPMTWFSGRHATIERNSYLVFHMAYDARTGQPMGAAIDEMTSYLQTVGLTEAQARFLANAAIPSDGWAATEEAAKRLGFRWQIVSSFFGGVRSCQAKFCFVDWPAVSA